MTLLLDEAPYRTGSVNKQVPNGHGVQLASTIPISPLGHRILRVVVQQGVFGGRNDHHGTPFDRIARREGAGDEDDLVLSCGETQIGSTLPTERIST
jgi:hypothetical protein